MGHLIPQIYLNDVDVPMAYLQGSYSYSLNSQDKYDPELPLMKPKAFGGTMILWKLSLDPYVTIHPVSSPAILPIIFTPPNSPASIHVAVYLPTHGHESKFVEELSTLEVCLHELADLLPAAPVYLRGDFNVNANNNRRVALLSHFCDTMNLKETNLQHLTYHHFTGNGKSDSALDKIISSNDIRKSESIKHIVCKLDNPAVESHHDVIISTFHLPVIATNDISTNNIEAPKVENNRSKVVWSDEGIENYQNIVIPELQRIQELWLTFPDPTKTLLSLFCESTNNILSSCAIKTNKSVKLNQNLTPRSKHTPLHIRKSSNQLLKKHNSLKQALHHCSPEIHQLRAEYVSQRTAHRKLVRAEKSAQAVIRDSEAAQILSKDPSLLFKKIKTAQINKLVVGERVYCDDKVSDGFYDSISRCINLLALACYISALMVDREREKKNTNYV